MKKVLKFTKKRMKWIILLIIIATVASIFLYNSSKALEAANQEAAPSFTPLFLQDIENVIMASGNTNSATSRNVTALLTTKITEVRAAVGDVVNIDDVLALQDTSDIDTSIDQTKKSVGTADTQWSTQVSVAERKLQDALNQYSIDATNAQSAIDKAAADLNSAKNNYDNAVKQQKTILDGAKFPDFTALQAAYGALSKDDKENPTNLTVSAYNAYNSAVQAATAADVEVVKNRVAYDTAKSTWEKTERADSLAIESARDGITSTRQNDPATGSRNQLSTFENQKDNATITAPIRGVVTAVTAEVGGMPQGVLFTIQDLDNFEITTTVASYDAVKLFNGLKAIVTTDSTGDAKLPGILKEISPIAIDTSGNFSVTVSIQDQNADLRAGVPAKIQFITQQKTGVFAVPIDAVIDMPDGKVIFVYDKLPADSRTATQNSGGGGRVVVNQSAGSGGTATRGNVGGKLTTDDGRRSIKVTTGMETAYLVEIISEELHEGLLVIDDPLGLNTTTDAFSRMISSGGPTAFGGNAGGNVEAVRIDG